MKKLEDIVQGTLGRRDFVRSSASAFAGAAALAHLPWLASQVGHVPGYAELYARFLRDPLSRSIDGFAYLADALGGGLSALRLVDTAYGAAVDDTYFVNINITCGICPKFFTIFGTPDTTTGKLPNGLLKTGKITDSKTYLETTGLETITTHAQFKELRMTKWFTDILVNGTEDGLPLGTNLPDALKKYVDPFPATGINMQVAHGLKGGVSHLFSSLLMGSGSASNYGDLNYELQRGGLVSPLQILCFGLFGTDAKDPNSGENRISGPAFSTELLGKTTESFLATVNQFVADSYIKTTKCVDNNAICGFDKLARSKEANDLRGTMLEKIASLKLAIAQMGPNIAAVTTAKHRFDKAMGMQAPVPASVATVPSEGPNCSFLSQVASTCELIKNLDSYRNFSLYLNLVDLDGDLFDTVKNNETVSNTGQNYVNGSRQLGIALNMLAKVMKSSGKKVIVHVCADTGRNSQAAVDAEASTAFLMAPSSVGLKDHLYAAPSILANDASTNQGGFEPSSNAVPWGRNLKKADGSLDTAGTTDFKHWAAGVYKLVMGARFKSEAYVEIEKA